MNLYEIPAAYEAWLQAVEQAEGELSPELEEQLHDIEGTLLQKADAVCALVRNATAEAEICRHEARGFQLRAQQAEQRAERLKLLLLRAMQAFGVERLQSDRFRVGIRKASTPSIRWEGPEDEMPPWAMRIRVELDGQKAQEKLRQTGNLEDGFTVEYSQYLAIR